MSDKVNTFHDAWHKGHMTAPSVVENYTPAGMKAIEQNMQVVSPPIYLTGYLEFQDLLGEEPVRSLCRPAAGQATCCRAPTNEWKGVISRIGRAKLKEELASYKAVMPKKDKPV